MQGIHGLHGGEMALVGLRKRGSRVFCGFIEAISGSLGRWQGGRYARQTRKRTWVRRSGNGDQTGQDKQRSLQRVVIIDLTRTCLVGGPRVLLAQPSVEVL